MTAPLVFLDTETDGVHPGRQAWEIACIRREPDGTETEWHAFLDINLSTADPFGLQIGRFYDRHPLGQFLASTRNTYPVTGPRMIGPGTVPAAQPEICPAAHAAVRIARMTHGAHIVAAVPSFDTEILETLLRAQGLTPAWNYHLIDIEALAMGYLRGQGIEVTPPWSSGALTEQLGIKPTPDEDRHTAMADTRWAMNVYDAVMTKTALAE